MNVLVQNQNFLSSQEGIMCKSVSHSSMCAHLIRIGKVLPFPGMDSSLSSSQGSFGRIAGYKLGSASDPHC